MDIMKIKVETYIPESYFNNLIESLKKIGAFEVDNSDDCICFYKLNSFSTLQSNDNVITKNSTANPEEEIKVEFKCCYNLMDEIYHVIKKIHPYKKPIINIFPLLY